MRTVSWLACASLCLTLAASARAGGDEKSELPGVSPCTLFVMLTAVTADSLTDSVTVGAAPSSTLPDSLWRYLFGHADKYVTMRARKLTALGLGKDSVALLGGRAPTGRTFVLVAERSGNAVYVKSTSSKRIYGLYYSPADADYLRNIWLSSAAR